MAKVKITRWPTGKRYPDGRPIKPRGGLCGDPTDKSWWGKRFPEFPKRPTEGGPEEFGIKRFLNKPTGGGPDGDCGVGSSLYIPGGTHGRGDEII